MLQNLRIRRRIKHLWQRLTRGFDDSDTWHLDVVIARFALPRLKRFKELNNGFPQGTTPESWGTQIDDMIYAMQSVIRLEDDADCSISGGDIDFDRMSKGLMQFGVRFRDLWW